jgi:cytochrome c biogenesis protein CcdA
MKEFWMWVIIVTLIIIALMGLSFLALYQHKQLKKTEAILMRAEERERKLKTLTEKEKDDE